MAAPHKFTKAEFAEMRAIMEEMEGRWQDGETQTLRPVVRTLFQRKESAEVAASADEQLETLRPSGDADEAPAEEAPAEPVTDEAPAEAAVPEGEEAEALEEVLAKATGKPVTSKTAKSKA